MAARASLLRSVADSIDAPVAAMPWIAKVMAGLSALGSSPRTIARWLGEAGVGPRSSVLDLGCGKGAVAVEVAARLGCRVVGIDGFEPFVEAARVSAERRGVGHLCTFEAGDARRATRVAGRARWRPGRPWHTGGFDVAMMIGLFDLEEALAVLRPLVRPGGLMLIDDCVSIGRGAPADDAPLTRREARMLVEEHGDRVEREMVFAPSRVRRTERALMDQMRARVREIVASEPRARVPLRALLARQRAEAAALVGPVRPAMWLVRRRSGGGR